MNCTCRVRVNYNVSVIGTIMTLIVEMIYPVPYLSLRCIDLVYGLIYIFIAYRFMRVGKFAMMRKHRRFYKLVNLFLAQQLVCLQMYMEI